MDAPRCRLKVGSATFTMVLSTTTRKTDRQRMGRINQRRVCPVAVMRAPYRTLYYCYSTLFFSTMQGCQPDLV